MSVEVITTWYNESFLAPFFLRHYAWADKITLLYDRDTTDDSLRIAQSFPNVAVKPFRFPDMLDEGIKQIQLNDAYQNSECDWVVLVDADEFVFFMAEGEPCADIRPVLETTTDTAFMVNFYTVFRHRTDAALNPDLPVVPQRRHGHKGEGKPCIARTGLGIKWKIGCHCLADPLPEKLVVQLDIFGCAHWTMADTFCFKRRLRDRKERQSRRNIERGMDCHNHSVTIQDLKAILQTHLDDPRVI